MSALLGTVLASAIGLTLLACGGSNGAPSSRDVTAANPNVSPANPTTVPSATPAASSPGYAVGTSTGIAAIDPVVEAITNGRLTKLLALTRTFDDPCFAGIAEGLAQACTPGEAPGTLIDTFVIQICTGGFFVRAAEMAGVLRPLAEGNLLLFAVYEVENIQPRKNRPSEPFGYAVIFRTASRPAQAVVVHVDVGGRLFAVEYGCSESPERTVAGWAPSGRLVLPPPTP